MPQLNRDVNTRMNGSVIARSEAPKQSRSNAGGKGEIATFPLVARYDNVATGLTERYGERSSIGRALDCGSSG
jgi:hypothetical protein